MTATNDLIDRFEDGADVLAYATQGLAHDQLTARPGPGDWSIAEVVHHLVDTDLVYGDRIKRLIAEPNPRIQGFDETAWVVKLDYQNQPLPDAVALFAAHRRSIARLLRAQTQPVFANKGTHSERGTVTLADILATITSHLDHHLRFLYTKRANLGVALEPKYTGISP
jgi:uncharacterized damage-inducible protein DinB